ncbi:MAG: spondin domain-containing protein [Phycisphaerae bacterium]|jgi:hypothetical protein
MRKTRLVVCTGLLSALFTTAALADDVQVRVTVQNLAPANSVTYSPLSVGFGNGTYDAFDAGSLAGSAIQNIAEFGNPVDWFPAFMAAEPDATLGQVVPNPPGPLTPGQSASTDFTVDPTMNRYFSFGAMVVPSNDYFIGNDSPMAYELFDGAGQLNLTSISLYGSDVWDAGTEVDGVFGAAFLVGSSAADHTPDDELIAHDYMDLDMFNGLTTAAGYTFDRQFCADDEIYRISFAIVPEPSALALLAVAGFFALRRR